MIQNLLGFAFDDISFAPYTHKSTDYSIQRNKVDTQDDFLNFGQVKNFDYFTVFQTSSSSLTQIEIET
jgi:hypothetical protein